MRGQKWSNHADLCASKPRWLIEGTMLYAGNSSGGFLDKFSLGSGVGARTNAAAGQAPRCSSIDRLARAFSSVLVQHQRPSEARWLKTAATSLPSTRPVVKGKVCPALAVSICSVHVSNKLFTASVVESLLNVSSCPAFPGI